MTRPERDCGMASAAAFLFGALIGLVPFVRLAALIGLVPFVRLAAHIIRHTTRR